MIRYLFNLFSFFLNVNRKSKKSAAIVNENKENYSSPITSSITHDKNLTNDKIHIDITENPSDKSLHTYDSNKSSPRDLSSLSSPPPPSHQVRKPSIVPNKIYRVSARHTAKKNFLIMNDYYLIN